MAGCENLELFTADEDQPCTTGLTVLIKLIVCCLCVKLMVCDLYHEGKCAVGGSNNGQIYVYSSKFCFGALQLVGCESISDVLLSQLCCLSTTGY